MFVSAMISGISVGLSLGVYSALRSRRMDVEGGVDVRR